MGQERYAQININTKTKVLDKPFTYGIPEELVGKLEVGAKVFVPFGRGNKPVDGYVVGFLETTDYDKVKNILRHEVALSLKPWQIKLTQWMRKRYFCTMSESLSLLTPPKLAGHVKEIRMFRMNPTLNYDIVQGKFSARQKIIKRMLEAFKEKNVIGEDVLKKEYGATNKHIETLLEKEILLYHKVEHFRMPALKNWNAKDAIQLNYDQDEVYKKIQPVITSGQARNFLLHGITGSGKTEIYIKLVEDTLKLGKQAIVLIPEIGLTPQIVGKFYQRFGDKIAVFHSKLSNGQRYDQWVQVSRGEKSIIIGPRSALLSPCHNLGLVIIDESHDMAYKSDKNPKFHSREVAFALGSIHGAPVLLGTATPSVETLRLVEQGKVEYLSILRRYNNALLPTIDIVDMRKELLDGNKSIFSNELKRQMADILSKGQQVILFLNRKGYANFIKCKECGDTLKCPNCDISLTYHKYDGQGKCNYCGYYTQVENTCPSCGSEHYKQFGQGTEKVEEEVMSLFPQYNIGRLDSMVASQKGKTEEVLRKFQSGDYSILIGTQMITKGLDFSNVTLVGVLSADILLNFPDYQASERAYQLLTQVAGRAGRGDMKGHVLIQTYTPDHFTLAAVEKQDFNGFIREEQLLRKTFHYPPYVKMANIIISGSSESRVERVAMRLGQSVKNVIEKNNVEIVEILGPNPALYSKIKNRYRWQIIIKYQPSEFNIVRQVLNFLCIEKSEQLGLDDVTLNVDIDAIKLL